MVGGSAANRREEAPKANRLPPGFPRRRAAPVASWGIPLSFKVCTLLAMSCRTRNSGIGWERWRKGSGHGAIETRGESNAGPTIDVRRSPGAHRGAHAAGDLDR